MADLKALREFRGLNQVDVAVALGVSERQVRRWENGESTPPTGKLVTLARVYAVTIDDLMTALGETEAIDTPGAPVG